MWHSSGRMHMSRSMNKIAITMGDPRGVGPEIVALVATDPHFTSQAAITLFGDPIILDEAARLCKLLPVSKWDCTVVTVSDTHQGHISQQYVAHAVEFCMAEKAALVTAPINKYRWGISHGHTEYLAQLTDSHNVGMMMAGPRLRTVPVTIHEPLTRVPGLLSIEKIVIQSELTIHFLQKYFKVAIPRIAVTGLNPHAGEQGNLGDEELSIIYPAIQQLQERGYDVAGPFPADGLFARTAQGYDAVICMYHDQALIPAKMLDFCNTVNVTMGLPFIRTSPDHGTAEDIAWQGKADAQHLRAAVEVAITLASPLKIRGGRGELPL